MVWWRWIWPKPDAYLWSVTDNGLAKATLLDDYPIQGRYGQGVINVRLPKESEEVVAAIIGPEKTQVIIMTALGSTHKTIINKTTVGGRSIKPRPVWKKLGQRNRVTGAVRLVARPDIIIEAEDETAVPQQLPLLSDESTKRRKRTKSKRT